MLDEKNHGYFSLSAKYFAKLQVRFFTEMTESK